MIWRKPRLSCRQLFATSSSTSIFVLFSPVSTDSETYSTADSIEWRSTALTKNLHSIKVRIARNISSRNHSSLGVSWWNFSGAGRPILDASVIWDAFVAVLSRRSPTKYRSNLTSPWLGGKISTIVLFWPSLNCNESCTGSIRSWSVYVA